MDLTEVYGTLTGVLTTQPALTQSLEPSAVTPGSAPVSSTTPTPPVTSGTQRTPTIVLTIDPEPCDQAAPGMPIDVTIPDDTVVEPGYVFTKIWRLENAGTCTWTVEYRAAFFYGDRMNAPDSVPLNHAVAPGAVIEISVDMVAPFIPGTYQGNWKLSNTDGELFGIGPDGDAPFWVRIIVSDVLPGTPTATQTLTPEFTNTPTITTTPLPTATPPVQAGGIVILAAEDTIDLDTLLINSPSADLAYQFGTFNNHWLIPQESALLGVFGSQEPGLEACQSASMSAAPIAVESLAVGTYLCYLTDQGLFGQAGYSALDPQTYALTLDLLTWAQP